MYRYGLISSHRKASVALWVHPFRIDKGSQCMVRHTYPLKAGTHKLTFAESALETADSADSSSESADSMAYTPVGASADCPEWSANSP